MILGIADEHNKMVIVKEKEASKAYQPKICGKNFQKIKINPKIESTKLALHVFQARKNKIDN